MKRIFLGIFALSVFQYAGNLSDNPMIYKEKWCARGSSSDCNDLAYIYYKEQNYKMAYDFLSISCEYGNFEGCLGLGLLYEKGQGVLMNYSKALHFYEMSCKLHNATGCLSAGLLYAKGQNINLKKASALFKKSCDLGSSDGCEAYNIMRR